VSEPSDEALLAAHLRGDPGAFGQLVARHERRIYGLCLRILGNREDAEDAAQEAFLAALRRASSFRRAAAFSTWLYRIAVNAATDQARRRIRSRSTPLDPEDAGLTAAPGGELGEVVAATVTVQTALSKVPEEFRVAVVLCDLYRIPYADAAQILEIPVGTVKSRVFRGRLALADHLGPVAEDAGPGGGSGDPVGAGRGPGAEDAGPNGGSDDAVGAGPEPRSARPGAGRAGPWSAGPDSATGAGPHLAAGAGPGPGGAGSGATATAGPDATADLGRGRRRRPTLRVVGGPGTEGTPAASDPTEADRPNQE
jgi:RNA polymerase sigma-70 factor (ECF subfamily)